MRFAVVPVALAAMALAACQDDAPTAVVPTGQPTAPTAAPTAPATQEPTAEPTQAPVTPTEQPSPTSSATYSPPAAGGAGVCSSSSSYEGQPGPAAKPIGSLQTFDKSGTVEITVSKPTIDTKPTSSTYYPGEGMVTAIFPVTMKPTSASYFITSPLKFTLVDDSKRPCKRDTLNYAVPEAQQIQVKSLRQGEALSTKLVFAVPKSADLTKYQVLFTENYPGVANVAWTAS
ncbi:hypothetical protein VV02_17550 [Luteipulveratus mongoliensis]|uniref:DUF4352 domain-containing protein n=2 Tax=Luteipulveratus mongoliensis TaxID=571913 RepID=A0A0K1JKL0_9MICO|nr:hypothetical protein VV02_17550 [Luteipulveratus mongoliensis]